MACELISMHAYVTLNSETKIRGMRCHAIIYDIKGVTELELPNILMDHLFRIIMMVLFLPISAIACPVNGWCVLA